MTDAKHAPDLDLEWIRGQFPALQQVDDDGRPLVFFDGPGGTHVPEAVIDAVARYYRTDNANTHGAFVTSRKTDEMLATAHRSAAELLGCDADEVVFGQNMTSLTFAVSRAIGNTLAPGDEVLLTTLDHDANYTPWVLMARDRGVTVNVVDIDPRDCTLDLADFERKLGARTRLVAVGMASNATGSRTDVERIARRAHEVGALVYADAVHYAPHGPLDVRRLDCDFLACSAYKFFGPHLGLLYGRRSLLTRLEAYRVRPAGSEGSEKWETGTLNHEGIAGFVAAIDYLESLGRRVAPSASSRRDALVAAMTAVQAYERGLSERLLAGLARIPGLKVYGIDDPERLGERTPTFSVRVAGHSPGALARHLAARGICCWDGNFYAQNLAERLDVEATGGFLRIGLVHYNTVAEIERLAAALAELPPR
jgi:cysteine desulfurase family protein (TIGR01976 family)